MAHRHQGRVLVQITLDYPYYPVAQYPSYSEQCFISRHFLYTIYGSMLPYGYNNRYILLPSVEWALYKKTSLLLLSDDIIISRIRYIYCEKRGCNVKRIHMDSMNMI